MCFTSVNIFFSQNEMTFFALPKKRLSFFVVIEQNEKLSKWLLVSLSVSNEITLNANQIVNHKTWIKFSRGGNLFAYSIDLFSLHEIRQMIISGIFFFSLTSSTSSSFHHLFQFHLLVSYCSRLDTLMFKTLF